MYSVYLGGVLLPVTPSKIQTKVKGQNKTINLINGEEVNIVKSAGLTEISFECLLPMREYSFAQYSSGYVSANYFTDQLEKRKQSKKSFNFTVSRTNFEGDQVIFKTHMLVTLEDYTIVEDSEQGGDLTVSIKLKEYVNYGLKKVKIPSSDSKNTKGKVTTTRASTKQIPSTYTVQKGDTMWSIAKKLLGDGAKCWNLAKLNGLSNPNLLRVGQVLKIQDVAASSGTNVNKEAKSVLNAAANTLVGLGMSMFNSNSNKLNTAVGGMSLLLQNASPEAKKRAAIGLIGTSGYSDNAVMKDFYSNHKSVGLQAVLGGGK